MSNVMLDAILRMPPELWNGDNFDVIQRHSRYVQAADEIQALREAIKSAREALELHDSPGTMVRDAIAKIDALGD